MRLTTHSTRRAWLRASLCSIGAASILKPSLLAAQPTLQERLVADFLGWDHVDDHRTGSDGDQRTARWLAERLQQAGVTPELERFSFQRRILGDCYVDDGAGRIPAVPLFDAPGTRGRPVSGMLSDSTEAAVLLAFYEPFSGHPATRRLQAARESGRHEAIIAVAAGETVKPGLALLNADRYGSPFGPPVLQVATSHAERLRRHAAADGRVEVVAPMVTTPVEVSNVYARIRGTRPELAPVVIMTPRSAWWTCTAERGGGVALWLEAARHWAASRPPRDVILTANTGHELGHLGLEHFLDRRPALIRDAHAWVHLGANFAAAGGEVLYQASDDDLMRLGRDALTRASVPEPEITPVGQPPLGEARNVFDGDGRYVSLLGSNPLFHHPDDRWPRAVDLDKTRRLAGAMLDVIAQLVSA